MEAPSGELSTLAARLSHLRQCAGAVLGKPLSQRGLDALACCHPGHTRAIEEGERANVEYKTAARLASVLGARVGWLLEGEGGPPGEEEMATALAVAYRTLPERRAARDASRRTAGRAA